MQETLNEHDYKDYKNSLESEKEAYLKKSANIIKQYLLAKNNIIEAIKNTFLFPYLLEMEYLIGSYEGVPVSDSPNETLPYFKMRNGIKELMNIDIDSSTINNWNVFRIKIPIKNKMEQINYFTAYCYIRIAKVVDYFFFAYYNQKIYDQELTLTMLDKQPIISDIKKTINDSLGEENEQPVHEQIKTDKKEN